MGAEMKGEIPGIAVVIVSLALPIYMEGQGRGGAPPAPVSGRAGAGEDLTGYWVSLVTEDWRYRMVTPAKGDYASVPLNPEGRQTANAWDPAKDEAAGEQCKSYGAAGLMRVPGRLHITWADDNTLKVETDAGTQTRLLHFGASARPPSGEAGWQGFSLADWELAGAGRGRRGGGAETPRQGSLKVVTTHMRPGYLRKNGVPYSANTVLSEYYTRVNETNGDSYLIITTIVEDPQYLQQPFVTSTHFKKEANGAKWDPTPCTAR
jgi:hypothetical protein